METLPMVAWDRRRYLFVPRPCRKKSLSRAIYGFVPQVSVNGCKDFASERNESLLSNCRAPLNLLQRYEEYFIPPNKITNNFQLFSSSEKWHIAKLCELLTYLLNIIYRYIALRKLESEVEK